MIETLIYKLRILESIISELETLELPDGIEFANTIDWIICRKKLFKQIYARIHNLKQSAIDTETKLHLMTSTLNNQNQFMKILEKRNQKLNEEILCLRKQIQNNNQQ